MPSTTRGIGDMLNAFAANIPGTLATKYGVTAAEIQGVVQAQLVWGWFDDALEITLAWSVGLTVQRVTLSTGTKGSFDLMPVVSTLNRI